MHNLLKLTVAIPENMLNFLRVASTKVSISETLHGRIMTYPDRKVFKVVRVPILTYLKQRSLEVSTIKPLISIICNLTLIAICD